MDWSDEKGTADSTCAISPNFIECDEHLCDSNEWSCGDGQCIPYFSRYVFQTFYADKRICFTMREFSHMCETYYHPSQKLWTMPNGHCWFGALKYNDSFWNMKNSNLSRPDKCRYLIRCALSGGLEASCPCDGTNCIVVMKEVCLSNVLYQYPYYPIIRPWLHHFYTWNRTWTDPTPDKFLAQGSIKCRGYRLVSYPDRIVWASYNRDVVYRRQFDYYFCHSISSFLSKETESNAQYSINCWNDTRTFNDRPYAFLDVCTDSHECISQYRIRDGAADCADRYDEDVHGIRQTDHCFNLRKHRFQCSLEQTTCLPVSKLAQTSSHCDSKKDIFIKGSVQYLGRTACEKNDHSGCLFLRYYIGNSSIHNSTMDIDISKNNLQGVPIMPHHVHCDSTWDEQLHVDENRDFCQQWVCGKEEYQCQSGQCIQLSWVCDGEWDCSDASDEEAIVLIKNWSEHNRRLSGLDERREECRDRYSMSKMPFSDVCDVTREYPCYLASVFNALDIRTHRPCINLTQIGDNVVNCDGGIDEKNTLENCDGQMLGLTLRCDNECHQYHVACTRYSPCLNSSLCAYKSKNETCSGAKDAVCLNGTCVQNARCDGIKQCLHGEDEYWCSPHADFFRTAIYRFEKEAETRSFKFSAPSYPPSAQIRPQNDKSTMNKETKHRQSLKLNSNEYQTEQPTVLDARLYICNRGIAFAYSHGVWCFCPPAYYGDHCEFFSDRLTIITHLDLSTVPTSSTSVFQVVATLLFSKQPIDHHIFYVNPLLETSNYVKQRFYLLYSRSAPALSHKQWRYFNRTNIISKHPYSVHFDVYALQGNETVELGSFHYPIYFDYIPAFRLATVLRFPSWFGNSTVDPCAENSCNSNSICKPILNKKQQFYCSCKSGYSGKDCTEYEQKCSWYCSSDSVCRPHQRGIIRNSDKPLCICPLGRFGPRCHLRNDGCISNSCGPNSTCHLTYDPSGNEPIICECSKEFYGDRCQYEKVPITIDVNMTSPRGVSVIQFYAVNVGQLAIEHQELVLALPVIIRYNHGESLIPSLSLLKVYEGLSDPQYFILYFLHLMSFVNITSTPHHCPTAMSLLPKGRLVWL